MSRYRVAIDFRVNLSLLKRLSLDKNTVLKYSVLEAIQLLNRRPSFFPASFELVPSCVALNQMRLTTIWRGVVKYLSKMHVHVHKRLSSLTGLDRTESKKKLKRKMWNQNLYLSKVKQHQIKTGLVNWK